MEEHFTKIQSLHLNFPQLIHKVSYQMLISCDSKARCWAIFLSLCGSAAQADDLAMMMRAQELSSVIAAEEFCGLNYDQPAIEAWIAANVPPEDMAFSNMLTSGIMGAEFQQKQMSTSAKTAHCAAIAQTAKHYGFVKD